MAQVLTIAEIKQLIFEKEDEMRKLSFHRNNSLAVERWHDLQDDLAQLRRMASNL